MMLSRLGLTSRLGLEVKHVLPKVVELCFVKLRREDGVCGEFEEFKRSAYAWNDSIGLDPFSHNRLQRLIIVRDLLSDGMMVEKVFVQIALLCEDLLKQVCDVIGADDATVTPDLDHV